MDKNLPLEENIQADIEVFLIKEIGELSEEAVALDIEKD